MPGFGGFWKPVPPAVIVFTTPWFVKLMQRVPDTSFPARDPTEGARKRDVPGVFVTDPGEVCPLSRGAIT
jgi:hypothetical protein